MRYILLAILLTGCASFTPKEDGKFTVSRTPFCNVTVYEEYEYVDGKQMVTKRFVTTGSDAKGILGELNATIGTGVGVARDLMP